MKRTIITISREYGSGGRLVGERVAEQLGIPFYNHNLIDMVAQETGMAADYISNWEEQVASPRLWGVPAMTGFGGSLFDGYYYSNEDRMFAAQSKIILNIAEEGSAVIVGRCADYLLRDNPDAIRIFVFAEEKQRIERIWKTYGAPSREEAVKYLRAVDKGRAAYVRKYADRDWGDMRNYHLILDSGRFGVDGAAAIIVLAAESRS